MSKRVLVFGTFDGLHEGHKSFLAQASKFGEVMAVIGRDSTVEKLKGKKPKYNENERLRAVKESGLVTEVRLGNEAPPGEKLDPYQVIWETKPNIICLGYDQIHFVDKLEAKIKEKGLNIEVKRMDSFEPEKYHSSLLNK